MSKRLLNSYFRSIGPSDNTFIESYVASSEYNNSLLNFTILIQINNKIDEVPDIAEQFVDVFKKSFIDSTKQWFDRFEDAIFNCNEFLLEICDKTLLSKRDFNIVVTGCINNKILFSKLNFGEIFLLRDGALNHLSDSMKVDSDSEFLFTSVASGNLEPGDKFLLTLDRLQRYLSVRQIESLISTTNDDEMMDNIESSISKQLEARIGCLLLVVENTVEKKSENQSSMSRSLLNILKGRGFMVDSITKKNLYIVLFFLSLILVFGSYVSFTRVLEIRQMETYNAMLDEARLIVSTAKSQTDKSRAAFTLKSAEDKLDKLKDVKSLSKQINNLKSEISETYASIDNVRLFKQPEILVDLDQNYPGSFVKSLAVLDNNLNVFTDSFKLESLSSFIKDPIAYSNKIDITQATFMPYLVANIILDSDSNVYSFENNSLINLDLNKVNISSVDYIQSYGRRLYILDTENKQIYKSQRVRNILSTPSQYFAAPIDDLENAISMSIDGSVYVAFNDASIKQYYQGSENVFFKLESEPLTKITSIDTMFTDFDHDYLYILESKGNRIVRFYKQNDGDLDYVDQISFPDVRDAKYMYVDYNSSKIYLANDKKVYLLNVDLK
jgi:hypothetical protein